ncbi:MAG TPA: hypothetical protein VNW90_25370 [Acetobacteraceae bacterium]|nr:hypothetical protein [Acetobacteraceae bacterium]
MKKKTNLQTPTEGEVKPRQHGPQKEKTQITIRVDTNLMNEAYAQMKEDNTRITDIVERGLVLALTERNHQLPKWNKEVRFMVANATKQQQALIRGLLIAMVEPLLDRKDTTTNKVIVDGKQRAAVFISHAFTPETEKIFELVRWFLELRNKSPHAPAALEYYSRYGKSAEEMAELANL